MVSSFPRDDEIIQTAKLRGFTALIKQNILVEEAGLVLNSPFKGTCARISSNAKTPAPCPPPRLIPNGPHSRTIAGVNNDI